jgi:hypothetical protein
VGQRHRARKVGGCRDRRDLLEEEVILVGLGLVLLRLAVEVVLEDVGTDAALHALGADPVEVDLVVRVAEQVRLVEEVPDDLGPGLRVVLVDTGNGGP